MVTHSGEHGGVLSWLVTQRSTVERCHSYSPWGRHRVVGGGHEVLEARLQQGHLCAARSARQTVVWPETHDK